MTERLFAGVDAGGSHCRVHLFSADGELLAKEIGGSANAARNFDGATAMIVETVAQALDAAGLAANAISNVHVGAGVAGCHLPEVSERLKAWAHPFAELSSDTDLMVAHLGAHSGRDGATIVCGTGFSAMAVVNGARRELGGYGFPSGDCASGAWIGLEAIRSIFLAADGMAEKSALWCNIAGEMDGSIMKLANGFLNAPPVKFAAYAPKVFDAADRGDQQAISILRAASAYLDDTIRELRKFHAERFCLIGGVARELVGWLPAPTRKLLADPIEGPERGALYLLNSFAGGEVAQKANLC